MISCIIVEDQAPAQRVLQNYIRKIGTLELAGIFNNALSALEYLNAHKIDLIFLDIHLPKLSGIDFLQVLSYKPKVILTTAFTDYALIGYELDVVDYLLKPFSFGRFVKAVSKCEFNKGAKLNKQKSIQGESKEIVREYIFAKAGIEFLKIEIPTICYIKSNGDYTEVFTDETKYLVSHSLTFWVKNLPSEYFCRIHKSFIVNIHYVTKVAQNHIYIGNDRISIGRTYKDHFSKKFLNSQS